MVDFEEGERKTASRDALCLVDKLMELADEVLEDELYASARARTHIRYERRRRSGVALRTDSVQAQ